jgi:hypothetical protein
MPRPTALTPETAKILVDAMRRLPVGLACDLAGVHRSTFQKWRHRADEGEDPYAEFFANARISRAAYAADRLAVIHDAADADWKAAAWYLERTHAQHFQPRQKSETKLSGRVETHGSDATPESLTHGGHLLKSLGIARPEAPVLPALPDPASGGVPPDG